VSEVVLVGLGLVAVWAILSFLLWWLVPIAFALAVTWPAAMAMSALFMIFGGAIFFLAD
jgi:hypothetical protein